jgi:tryptophan synthase alpha chain
MSRLQNCFERLRQQGRKALIPYVTAGDPHPDQTLAILRTLVRAGADILELGVPFSDPMADGPVIQRAVERALVHRVSLRQVLELVRQFRETDQRTPLVLMGYLNPLEVMGYPEFATAAAAAGVDGVLTVDLPPEEGDELVAALRAHAIDPIFLLAPTSDEERIRRICDAASGFVYYVSIKGVTGAAHLDLGAVRDKIAAIKGHTQLPVGVGFGIKDAQTAAAIAGVADAVIVGSALVSRIEQLADRPEALLQDLAALVGSLRRALDQTAGSNHIVEVSQ